MARSSSNVRQEQVSVGVDDCRVRVQTGEPIVFLDARREEDRAASGRQIAGALRLRDEGVARPPCHKHNYIVVYCG